MPAVAPPEPIAPAADTVEALTSILAVSPEQVERLFVFRTLLEEWSGRFNLVGPSVMASFWRRHVLDSGQLVALAPEACRWTDLGSGAGFPGLVIAMLLSGRAAAHVTLIESMGKRCRFLEEVCERLNLPATVLQARAEEVRLASDVVTARACAPLPRLLEYARPHLSGGAFGLFLKGREVESELTAARGHWRLDAELLPSLSDPAGRILKVTRLERA